MALFTNNDISRYIQVIVSTIPEDIIHRHVFPYTHCPKPANLLQDIKTFEADFALARNYISPVDQDIGSFLNRIIFYCNNYLNVHEVQSNMLGDIIRRNVKYKNRYGLDIYYHVMDRHTNQQYYCRYLWDLHSCERTDFINNFINRRPHNLHTPGINDKQCV